MPKPPARKPLFRPPESSVTAGQEDRESTSSLKPGEKGWLMDLANKTGRKENNKEDNFQVKRMETGPSSSQERPKPGEKGWLVALADSLEEPPSSTQGFVMSSSQPASLGEKSGSQQMRPKPGEPGWLVAMVDNMETPTMEKQETTASQLSSRDMFSGQSKSQEIQRPKPGEPGWLVSLAESLEGVKVDRLTNQLEERSGPSQDSGKGKSMEYNQASKTSTSQVSSSQSSISSAFDLLASEEVTSQVLLCQEAIRQSQTLDDIAEAESAVLEDVPDTWEAFDEDIAKETVQEDNTSEMKEHIKENIISDFPDSIPLLATESPLITNALNAASSSSSHLSTMLDQILLDMKNKGKLDTVTKSSTVLSQDELLENQDCDEQTVSTSFPTQSSLPASSTPSLVPHQEPDIPELVSTVPLVAARSSQVPIPKTSNPAKTKMLNNDQVAKTRTGQVDSSSLYKIKVSKQARKVQKKPFIIKTISKAPKKTAHKSSNSYRKVSSGRNMIGEEVKAALLYLQRTRTACTWVMCTREECAKWRFILIKDPSLVEEEWVCDNNPDQRYGKCEDPEQWWDQGLRDKFVENRFTVGSLVWARLEGWPAWPGMVDDDPDTGDFFWTGVRGGEWEARPTQYHVVFFDSKEKGVTRAWVADRRLEKMGGRKEQKSAWSRRLTEAVEMASQAGREELDSRRKKYCMATRFKGHWGPVWPGWGEEGRREVGDTDSEDKDTDIEEEIRKEMMSNTSRSSISNTVNMNFSCDVIRAVPDWKAVRGKDGGRTSDNDNIDSSGTEGDEEEPARKVARLSMSLNARSNSKSCSVTSSSGKPNNSPSKENIPPISCARLYQDKSLYTEELSQKTVATTDIDSVFYHPEGEEEFNASLGNTVDTAMQLVDTFTPIKQTMAKIQQSKNVLTPSNRQSPQPPSSPALALRPPSTPNRAVSYLTSTPVSKSSLISPRTGKSIPTTPVYPPLPSPTGDCSHPSPLPTLNTTSGSTDFSSDGSFRDL